MYNFKLQFSAAKDLAYTGDPEKQKKAIEILFRMRIEPDPSLYHRASICTLISQCGDIEQVDCKKFVDEAIQLCDMMRRERAESEKLISQLEDIAIRTLENVKEVEAGLVARGKKVFPNTNFLATIESLEQRDALAHLRGNTSSTTSDSKGKKMI